MVRILTLNIHKGVDPAGRRSTLKRLRDAMRTVDADLLLLQEVVGDRRATAGRVDLLPQHQYLAADRWSHAVYAANKNDPTAGHHGNAILSHWPILRWDNLDVSTAGLEPRGLLHVVLQPPGGGSEFHAICVHLGLREDERAAQLARLIDLIATIPADAPLCIGGDFNDWRLRGHRRLRHGHGLSEAFADAKGLPARSFPVRLPTLRLDRLYLRNLSVSKRSVLARPPWIGLSDHAGLLIEAGG